LVVRRRLMLVDRRRLGVLRGRRRRRRRLVVGVCGIRWLLHRVVRPHWLRMAIEEG
jgi:hypothetical protein